MLTRPRDTIRQIVARDPWLHVLLLGFLAGVASALDRASSKNTGDELSAWLMLFAVVLIGGLGGLLTLWIGASFVKQTGRWIGGAAETEDLRAAIAWGSVPSVLNLLLWLPLLFVIGNEMFTADTPRISSQSGLALLLTGLALAMILMNLWSIILTCNTVAEVQKFRSAWKGLGNLVLAVVVAIAVFLIALLLIWGILRVA